uniref:Uncharacterized protein n=1 Tax=Brassica oleracea TaxID=3712 RepID=A0A3P6FU64_BRAOL|nr:unnamed protein product [Brassica oleracea]
MVNGHTIKLASYLLRRYIYQNGRHLSNPSHSLKLLNMIYLLKSSRSNPKRCGEGFWSFDLDLLLLEIRLKH